MPARLTAIGLKELEIKWKGAEFEFKDTASGVKLETEGDDLASTSLSVDVKGHEVMLLVNGQTLSVSLAGIVTSPYAYDQDEDGEVTFELPFGLTAASTIQLNRGQHCDLNWRSTHHCRSSVQLILCSCSRLIMRVSVR